MPGWPGLCRFVFGTASALTNPVFAHHAPVFNWLVLPGCRPMPRRMRAIGFGAACVRALDILCAGLGGGLGSVLRWAVGLLAARVWPGRFWSATLFVNVSGAFLAAALSGWLIRYSPVTAAYWLQVFLIAGVLGGYTTFSTLQLDAASLQQSGRRAAALAYVVLTLVAGLAAAALGAGLARG